MSETAIHMACTNCGARLLVELRELNGTEVKCEAKRLVEEPKNKTFCGKIVLDKVE